MCLSPLDPKGGRVLASVRTSHMWFRFTRCAFAARRVFLLAMAALAGGSSMNALAFSFSLQEASTVQAKETFVSSHSGGTIMDIVLSSVVPLVVAVKLYHCMLTSLSLSGMPPSTPMRVCMELALVFLPAILALMCQSALLAMLLVYLLCIAALSLYNDAMSSGSTTALGSAPNDDRGHIQHQHSVATAFRSSICTVTYLCILAVDFPAFPRKFCKTEAVGYGLMDLGGQAIIFCKGLCSRYSRHLETEGDTYEVRRKRAGVNRAVRKALPLALLGLLRFTVNYLVKYQQHLSEYGTHWNFFFTLCECSLIFYIEQIR